MQHALDRHDGFEAGDPWRVDGGPRSFLQQPLHQRVNGVQLTADRGVTAGCSVRFRGR